MRASSTSSVAAWRSNTRIAEISGAADDSKPWEYNAIPLENWVAANPPAEKGSAIAVVPVVGEIVDGEAPSGVAGGETHRAAHSRRRRR